MTRAVREKERNEAIEHLRKLLKPGDTVYTVLRHVSRSGMTRGIDCYYIDPESKEPMWITAYVGKAIDNPQSYRDWQNQNGLRITGCGMDMGFSVVYDLSRVLFPKGFDTSFAGRECPNYEHNAKLDGRTLTCPTCGAATRPAYRHNGPTEYVTDGGYALKQRWL